MHIHVPHNYGIKNRKTRIKSNISVSQSERSRNSERINHTIIDFLLVNLTELDYNHNRLAVSS